MNTPKYQLAKETTLVSESFREKTKQRTLDWLASLSTEEKEDYKNRRTLAWAEYLKRKEKGKKFTIALETKNKRNSCPQQILQKIKEVADKLGEVPTKSQFIVECGSQRYVHLIYKTYGSWSEALKMLGMQPKDTSWTGKKRVQETDEALLEYLQNFYHENGVIPTETDARRGLIPHSQIYARRFGGLTKARELAGIVEKPPKRKIKYFSR